MYHIFIILQILTVLLFCLAVTDALLTRGNGYRCTNDMDIPSAVYIADAVKAGTFVRAMFIKERNFDFVCFVVN